MEKLIRRSEDIERAAWQDLYRHAPRPVRRRLGLQAFERDRMTILSASRVDHLLLNRAIGLGNSTAPIEDAAEVVAEHFRRRNVERFWIQLGSHLRDSELPGLLGDRGIVPYPRSWMKFVRQASPVDRSACALRIRPARPEDAPRIGGILASAFDLPEEAGPLLAAGVCLDRWDYFVAENEELRVVATAAIYTRGDDGYLAFAGTLSEARRRGCQRALMAARLARAQDLRCRWVFTETGLPVEGDSGSSYRNILRAGFDELHVRDNFAPEGSRWQSRPSSGVKAKSAVSPKRSRTSLKAVARSGS